MNCNRFVRRFLAIGLAIGLVMSAVTVTFARAAEGYIGPLLLETVGVQQTPGPTGHLPGNLEVKLRSPATLPTGMTCDTSFITTKRENDPDKRLFALLAAAHLTGKQVKLQVSDDPALRAYPGRCSLLWVEVLP
jgi:hypothetical protein